MHCGYIVSAIETGSFLWLNFRDREACKACRLQVTKQVKLLQLTKGTGTRNSVVRWRSKMVEVPKKKKAQYPDKISVCVETSIKDLYVIGDRNGHDTAELVRQAVREALKKAEATLKTPA